MRDLAIGAHRIFKISWRRVALLLLLALLIAAAIMLGMPDHVHGDTPTVFRHRIYDIAIHNDGSVAVIEHWNIHIGSAPLAQAALWIPLARIAGIDIGPVAGASDGTQQVSRTHTAAGNEVAVVSWDFPRTQDADLAFDIPYVLHDAVGRGTSLAWFDWHYLLGATPAAIATDATVRLSVPPAGQNTTQIMTVMANGSTNVTNTNGAMTITAPTAPADADLDAMVTFPAGALDATYRTPAWQRSPLPPTLPTTVGGAGPSGAFVRVVGAAPDANANGTGPSGMTQPFDASAHGLPPFLASLVFITGGLVIVSLAIAAMARAMRRATAPAPAPVAHTLETARKGEQ